MLGMVEPLGCLHGLWASLGSIIGPLGCYMGFALAWSLSIDFWACLHGFWDRLSSLTGLLDMVTQGFDEVGYSANHCCKPGLPQTWYNHILTAEMFRIPNQIQPYIYLNQPNLIQLNLVLLYSLHLISQKKTLFNVFIIVKPYINLYYCWTSTEFRRQNSNSQEIKLSQLLESSFRLG